MNCTIITIGDELLLGQVIDTNSAWIVQKLYLNGISVDRRIAIGDDADAITHALKETVGKSNLVILTGGLGPTADDITKATLCKFFGGKLIIDQNVLTHVQEIFSKTNRPFLESNKKQAEVPDTCTVLFNRLGTAPGMWFEKNNSIIISLPGVPFEMKAIMEEVALPLIKKKLKGDFFIHKTVLTAGIGESFLAEQIKGIEASMPSHIKLAYLPSPGLVKLRLSGSGNNYWELSKEIDVLSQLIRHRIGSSFVGYKDIAFEQALVDLLKEHRLTVTCAESCTGGYIANKITNIPGSSKVFNGSVVTYSNDIKAKLVHVPERTLNDAGAVSEATVIAMAQGALQLINADISLAVSGILGPDGGTENKPVGTVWIAVAEKDKHQTKQLHLRYDRLENKELAATHALNLLRLWILEKYGK